MKLSKSFLFLTVLFATIFLSSLSTEAATNIVSQTNPVRVELTTNTTNVTTNGFYQIKNLSDNNVLLIKSGQPITFSKSGSILLAKLGAYNLSSTVGYELNEVTGPQKYVTFSAKKGAKRNAATTDPDVVTYDNGEAAEYVSTYSANGLTWYIINAKNGNQLAVLSDSTMSIQTPPVPQTVTVHNISGSYNVFRGNFKYYTEGSTRFINIIGMQSYLKGVVPNEMPAGWHLEALKSQAVAARSYAYVKNQRSILSSTTSSQVYRGYKSEHSNTNKAVDETNEKYVKYNNKVIETFFFSTSGGKTASVGDVWRSEQSSFPYLVSRDDPYESSPYSNWSYSFSAANITSSFNLDNQIVLYDIIPTFNKVGGGSGNTVNNEVSGFILKTSVGDKVFSGNESYIRKLFPVTGTYGMLPSNWFTIQAIKDYKIQTASAIQEQFGIKNVTVQLANGTKTIGSGDVSINSGSQVITKATDPATITLNGKGWGHRIGMSQYGANGFAKQGWTFEQILTHYYYGTTIAGL